MRRLANVPALAAACLFPFACAVVLPAQCTNVWMPANGELGVDAYVRASTMWDPDGAGPAPLVAITSSNALTATLGAF